MVPAAGNRTDRMKGAHFNRRTVLSIGLGLCVGGCLDTLDNPVLSNASTVAKNLILGYPDLAMKREAISKLPYASMAARIGRGPQSLLILSRLEGADQHWISPDRAVLVTRGGRVVKTYGFPENLRDTMTGPDDPVDRRLHLLAGPLEYTRRMALDVPSPYEVDVDSRFETVGPETITVFEVELETIVVRERNTARQVNWSFENTYWVDNIDGYVWQSTQHIARSFPPVVAQVLKPPG